VIRSLLVASQTGVMIVVPTLCSLLQGRNCGFKKRRGLL